jgi:hypothetical protein
MAGLERILLAAARKLASALRRVWQQRHKPKTSNMKTLLKFSLALALVTAALTVGTARAAEDWGPLNGKWTTKKTSDEGRSWTQVIEIDKGKFKFRILSSSGDVRLYAEGDVKMEKYGPFTGLKFHNIKAGQSPDSIEAVDEERAVIYQLTSGGLTVAADFDAERETPPSADKYTKSK